MSAPDGLVFAVARNAIPHAAVELARAAWGDIDRAERPSTSRRQAAGPIDLAAIQRWRPDVVSLEPVSPTSARLRLADGRVLRQVFSNPVHSHVAGFTVSRYGNRAGPGRLTRRHPDRWATSLPFFHEIDRTLARMVPVVHAAMAARAATHPAWCIPRTALSTVAVNINYESRYHRDRGDFREGLSTLTVVELGTYGGGLLVLPEHRVAVDVREGDVLVFPAHRLLHGNTAITGSGKRVSFVTYLKHGLADTVNAMEGA